MKKRFLLALLIIFVILGFSASFAADKSFPYLGKVTTSDVNIRSGPHVNFEIMGKLKKDRAVVVLEKKDGWLKIKLPKSFSVFVSSKYVQVEPNATSGIITSNRVNLRARPDAISNVIIQLNKGDIVRIRNKANDWYKIMPPANSFAWVNENFVQYVEPFVEQKNIESANPRVKTLDIKPTVIREQVQKPKENMPLAEGVVMDSGRLLNRRPLHKLVDDKGAVIYYLDADKRLLDSFSNTHVAIWGEILGEKAFGAPIIRVQKIHMLE